MVETRSAKKRKINDASSGNAGCEHGQSSAGDSKIDSGDESSDVIQIMKAMQKEMKKMQRKMGKMEKRLRMAESQMCVDNEGLANDIMELHNDQHETWKDTRAIKSALKYHRNLTRNQNNWVNPVPRVPSSYWISNGYDDNEAEIMKALVRNIREETSHMRLDGLDGRILLRVPTADQLIIPHDAAFLPYWEGRCR